MLATKDTWGSTMTFTGGKIKLQEAIAMTC